MAIQSFVDAGSEDISAQRNTKAARKALPRNLHRVALQKLILLDSAAKLDDLAIWPSLRIEKLLGARRDQHSIRINDRYRICFVWKGNDAFSVEIVDYH